MYYKEGEGEGEGKGRKKKEKKETTFVDDQTINKKFQVQTQLKGQGQE